MKQGDPESNLATEPKLAVKEQVTVRLARYTA